MSHVKGVLFINLGSPDAPNTSSVRKYLRQFLNDPKVIDVSPLFRWLLLNLIILPFRPKKSAHAYQSIWLPEGSPLVVYSKKLTEKVQYLLGNTYSVQLAMRYGNPSIESAFAYFQSLQIRQLLIIPLFPQYADATTGSILAECTRQSLPFSNLMELSFFPAFYDRPEFIDLFAKKISLYKLSSYDHIVFSYHGLPERHIKKSSPDHPCLSENCCDVISLTNQNCYRAQSVQTTKLITQQLGLKDDQFSIGFQSRLGRDPWITPDTHDLLLKLELNGKRRILIVAPSFVSDCLETLEELAIREREYFISIGGEELTLVASLNGDHEWANVLSKWISEPL